MQDLHLKNIQFQLDSRFSTTLMSSNIAVWKKKQRLKWLSIIYYKHFLTHNKLI